MVTGKNFESLFLNKFANKAEISHIGSTDKKSLITRIKLHKPTGDKIIPLNNVNAVSLVARLIKRKRQTTARVTCPTL